MAQHNFNMHEFLDNLLDKCHNNIQSHSPENYKISQVNDLLTKFKPIIYLHSEETYFPINPEYYIKNSRLTYNNNTDTEVIAKGHLRDHNLLTQNSNGERSSLSDRPPYYTSSHFNIEDVNDSMKNGEASLKSIPLSAHPTILKTSDNVLHYCIHYYWYFPYQGLNSFLGQGSHYGDWNHVTVELDSFKPNATLLQVYFSRHGDNTEGEWVKPADLDHDVTSKRFIVYLAKYNHIPYQKPGSYTRYYGLFQPDVTDNKGKVWDPLLQLLYSTVANHRPHSQAIDVTFDHESINVPLWSLYNGKWGKNGIDSPALNGFFITYERNHDPWYLIVLNTLPVSFLSLNTTLITSLNNIPISGVPGITNAGQLLATLHGSPSPLDLLLVYLLNPLAINSIPNINPVLSGALNVVLAGFISTDPTGKVLAAGLPLFFKKLLKDVPSADLNSYIDKLFPVSSTSLTSVKFPLFNNLLKALINNPTALATFLQ
jgi:hypothetical protein